MQAILYKHYLAMITFQNISKRFANGFEALNNIHVHIKKGEMVFLTGHSGAGKTTFLKLIMMIERASSGSIRVNDYHLERLGHRHIPFLRRKIGMIAQNPILLANRNIFDNVALPLHVSGYRKGDIKRRVQAALDTVGLLDKQHYYPEEISGGQQQRVGIARAIINKPTLLLADEPTGNLDPKLSQEIMRLFTRFQEIGTTVLIASHDISLIERLPFRRLTLQEGKLIHDTENG